MVVMFAENEGVQGCDCLDEVNANDIPLECCCGDRFYLENSVNLVSRLSMD